MSEHEAMQMHDWKAAERIHLISSLTETRCSCVFHDVIQWKAATRGLNILLSLVMALCASAMLNPGMKTQDLSVVIILHC